MYRVFTDFHHASLLNSLILLFEKRLGGKVYRPIGTDWHTQGYWKLYDHPATVEQFLGINGATPDGTDPLNQVVGAEIPMITQTRELLQAPGIYSCRDIENGSTNRAMTLECFMLYDIDIVIASLPQHIEPFKKLCELHPNHPKLIYQVGNQWVLEASNVLNVMSSARIPHIPAGIHYVEYHQEFDTEVFKPESLPATTRFVRSFVNCFNVADIFKLDWMIFEDIEKKMPDWKFEALGGQCRDGAAHGSQELADKMNESMFVWHTKVGGDGYGHVVHNAAACGKPLITRKAHYMGKMANDLMIDGETCIAIDGLSSEQIIEKINHFSDLNRYNQMSKNMYQTFKTFVNFDDEAEKLKLFLSDLR